MSRGGLISILISWSESRGGLVGGEWRSCWSMSKLVKRNEFSSSMGLKGESGWLRALWSAVDGLDRGGVGIERERC